MVKGQAGPTLLGSYGSRLLAHLATLRHISRDLVTEGGGQKSPSPPPAKAVSVASRCSSIFSSTTIQYHLTALTVPTAPLLYYLLIWPVHLEERPPDENTRRLDAPAFART